MFNYKHILIKEHANYHIIPNKCGERMDAEPLNTMAILIVNKFHPALH